MRELGVQEQPDWPRGMGKVAPRELMHAGYESLDSLSGLSARELLKIHGVGPKAIRVANEALVDRGLPPICE